MGGLNKTTDVTGLAKNQGHVLNPGMRRLHQQPYDYNAVAAEAATARAQYLITNPIAPPQSPRPKRRRNGRLQDGTNAKKSKKSSTTPQTSTPQPPDQPAVVQQQPQTSTPQPPDQPAVVQQQPQASTAQTAVVQQQPTPQPAVQPVIQQPQPTFSQPASQQPG